MTKREPKEIFYCNLTVLAGGKKVVLEKVVYKDNGGKYTNKTQLLKNNIKADIVDVVSVDVIHSMGFEFLPVETEAKEADTKESDADTRNKITGAYE